MAGRVGIMTDISIVRGDSRNFSTTIYEGDGVTAVNISDGILRMAVKRRPSDPNSEALIFKTSYDESEIDLTLPLEGKCIVQIRIDDTISTDPGSYCWDLDLSRKDSGTPATLAGTFDAVAGSEVLTYTGAEFSRIRVGSIIELAGAAPENNVRVLVTALDSTTQKVTIGGYANFTTEAGISHQTFDGDRKTPTGLSGTFAVLPDVVR
jgi:hypothetical protein